MVLCRILLCVSRTLLGAAARLSFKVIFANFAHHFQLLWPSTSCQMLDCMAA